MLIEAHCRLKRYQFDMGDPKTRPCMCDLSIYIYIHTKGKHIENLQNVNGVINDMAIIAAIATIICSIHDVQNEISSYTY